MRFYGRLFGAAARCYAAGCLYLQFLVLHRCQRSHQIKCSVVNTIVDWQRLCTLNYKQVKKDELAVSKGTSAILKRSALLPLARLGPGQAPRERLTRGGTRPKFISSHSCGCAGGRRRTQLRPKRRRAVRGDGAAAALRGAEQGCAGSRLRRAGLPYTYLHQRAPNCVGATRA